jgi:hypothetical protein
LGHGIDGDRAPNFNVLRLFTSAIRPTLIEHASGKCADDSKPNVDFESSGSGGFFLAPLNHAREAEDVARFWIDKPFPMIVVQSMNLEFSISVLLSLSISTRKGHCYSRQTDRG